MLFRKFIYLCIGFLQRLAGISGHNYHIIKILDIDSSDVNSKTIQYLLSRHVTYKDMCLKEHLYNIYDAFDEIGDSGLSEEDEPVIRIDINKLAQLATVNDAAYIRIIPHPRDEHVYDGDYLF